MATSSPSKMKVPDLRAALASRGMTTAGLKAELVSRLDTRLTEERHSTLAGAMVAPRSVVKQSPTHSRGSFGLESSTPKGSVLGDQFGSPRRYHTEAQLTQSPHRHHETRRGLWGVPLSETERNEGAESSSRVVLLSTALREEQLVVARERDARARDREHRVDAEEALRHARARMDTHDAEVSSLRRALVHARNENEAVTKMVTKTHGENAFTIEKNRELTEQVQVLRDKLSERDLALNKRTAELQLQIAAAAVARAEVKNLRERLDETKALLSQENQKAQAALEAQRNMSDSQKALHMHDPNPLIIDDLQKKLTEQRAIHAALDAAATSAIEESNLYASRLENANCELQNLRNTVQKLEGGIAESETMCLLHATDLEQTRWREAAAGTAVTHLEERVGRLETENKGLASRIESDAKASAHAVHLAATAEGEVVRADLRVRAAVEEKDAFADEARLARATAAAATLELRAVSANEAAAKANLSSSLRRCADLEESCKALETQLGVFKRESAKDASRARDVAAALRETREKLAGLSEKQLAAETLVEHKDARIREYAKRVKAAERKVKEVQKSTVHELETRDKENRHALVTNSKTLADRAEALIGESKKKAAAFAFALESGRKSWENEMSTTKLSWESHSNTLKARHAATVARLETQCANLVAAVGEEEALTEEAVTRATTAEARVRAAEASLERQRCDLRDATAARRDAEATSDAQTRKAKNYREEHETLIYKYEHLMRKLGRFAETTPYGNGNSEAPNARAGHRSTVKTQRREVSSEGREREGERRREETSGGERPESASF